MKIAFHDNQLCERGTTISLYDYAYFNKYYLGNESVIMYYGSDHRNVPKVINKFSKEFKLLPYENWNNDSNRLLKEAHARPASAASDHRRAEKRALHWPTSRPSSRLQDTS